jgi:MHS family proline/betaine transporter-like MFS transporter
MRRVVVSGMVGNALEWYDFALYGHLAVLLSQHFFPSDNPTTSLLATYGTFAAGFLIRPLGAVLFGYLGDTYGRKHSLAISIMMMAIPTACIGLLPTYAQIGIWAPILLTIIRLLQGLSLGGEFSGSITFIVEHSKDHKRGLAGYASFASLVIGMLMGSLTATLVAKAMSPADFESWGWRLPFLFGIVIGVVGFYIRHHTHESPKYTEHKEAGTISKTPVREAFRKHPWAMMQAVGIYLTGTVSFYTLFVFMLGFLTKTLHHPYEDALLINVITSLVVLASSFVSAYLSDTVGRKRILIAATIGFVVLCYPIFLATTTGGFWQVLAAQTVFAILMGTYFAPIPAILVELFPTSVRYTGMAISYNLSAALFGGTLPMLATWLIERTGNHMVIAFYVMIAATLSLITLLFYRDRYLEPLD